MEWHTLLKQAEQAESTGDIASAESFYDRAVQMAQQQLGPYDTNLAKCFLAYAQFLEQQKRYGDAQLRFKLAAGIYNKGGHSAAYSLAAGSADRMGLMDQQSRDLRIPGTPQSQMQAPAPARPAGSTPATHTGSHEPLPVFAQSSVPFAQPQVAGQPAADLDADLLNMTPEQLRAEVKRLRRLVRAAKELLNGQQ